jgi:CBS domain-containing protein
LQQPEARSIDTEYVENHLFLGNSSTPPIDWRTTSDMSGATRMGAKTGQFLAASSIIWGAFQVFFGIGFGGLWFVVIGWLLFIATKELRPSAPTTKILSPLCVGEVMRRDCDTVSGDIDLQAFVNNYVLRTRSRYYFVAEKNKPAGLISTEQVKSVPCEQWSRKTVSQIMSSLDNIHIIAPQMPVAKAYETMLIDQVNHLPVASNDQLAGIITRDDILTDLYTHVMFPDRSKERWRSF